MRSTPLRRTGLTVLVSTHYMDEAERCHRIAYISYGKLVAQGTVDDVVRDAGLTTLVLSGGDIAGAARDLASDPDVDQVAPFGQTLHVVGQDADALRQAVDRIGRTAGRQRRRRRDQPGGCVHPADGRCTGQHAMTGFFSLGRLRALLTKEFIQMRRDRVTFAMMLAIPLDPARCCSVLRSTPTPRNLPAALVAPTQDRFTRAMVSALELTGYYRFIAPERHGARGRGNDRARRRGLCGDGSVGFRSPDRAQRPRHDPDRGRRDRPLGRLWRNFDAGDRRRPRRCSARRAVTQAVASGPTIVVHRRYNPEGITQYNIVPGLLGVILQLTMVMMTAMALTRETERGTMENLLSMPATPLEIMLGKILPYLAVGAVQVAVVLLAAQADFRHPLRRQSGADPGRRSCLRARAGHPRLPDFHRVAHADAGHAADVLLLSAVADAVGFHVSVSGDAALGAISRRGVPADPFPAADPVGDAQGRRCRNGLRLVPGAWRVRRSLLAGLSLLRFRRTLD